MSQPIEISFYQDNIRWSSCLLNLSNTLYRSSHPEVFLVKGVLKICSKFTGEHPCQSVISIKLLCNFIEITLRQECSSVNLLHIFRTPFPRTTSGCLLLIIVVFLCVVRMFWAIIYSYSVDSLETSGNKFNILVNLTELGNISSMLISYLKLKLSLKYYLCDFLTF